MFWAGCGTEQRALHRPASLGWKVRGGEQRLRVRHGAGPLQAERAQAEEVICRVFAARAAQIAQVGGVIVSGVGDQRGMGARATAGAPKRAAERLAAGAAPGAAGSAGTGFLPQPLPAHHPHRAADRCRAWQLHLCYGDVAGGTRQDCCAGSNACVLSNSTALAMCSGFAVVSGQGFEHLSELLVDT